MVESTPVILDVDTGIDDALALLLAMASKKLEIRGICTVFGNLSLEDTTRNTLGLIDLLGKHIPVYKGASHSLVKWLDPNRMRVRTCPRPALASVAVHDLRIFPFAPIAHEEPDDAVRFYIDALTSATEPITLVLLGAQTNLALALILRPEIAKNIREIVMMAGGHDRSNSSIAAEFNVYQDPEAAQIVAESGTNLTYIPLDATFQTCLTRADIDWFDHLHTKAGALAAMLIKHMANAYFTLENVPERDVVPMHDALAVAAILDRAVLKDVRFVRLDVDSSGGYADGRTLVDQRARTDKPKNARFAFSADSERFKVILKETIALLP